MSEVAQIVKGRRLDLGLTQVQVVERAEEILGQKAFAESTYRAFESGRTDSISPRTAAAVCKALRWPPDAIEQLRDGADPDRFLASSPGESSHDHRHAYDEIIPNMPAEDRAVIDLLVDRFQKQQES